MKKKNLKIVLSIFILLIVIFLGIRIYLHVYASKLEDKTFNKLGNNYYIKIIDTDNAINKKTLVEIWYTDEKQAIKTGNMEAPENFSKIYHDSKKKMSTLLPSNSNIASVVVDKNANWFSLYTNYIDFEAYLTNEEFMQIKSIKTKKIDNKECYVVKNKNKTIYIDKESNLPIKIEYETRTYTFEFSVGNVKEEDVSTDNLSEFFVTINTIIE